MDLKFPFEIDGGGRIVTVEGVEETKQRAYVALKSHQGEWDYDLSYGMPWRSLMTQRPTDLGAIRSAVVQQLLRVPGLDSVGEVTLSPDYDERTITITARCTASGTTFEVTV